MIKYLVLWTVITMVQVPCQSGPPEPDQYGRVSQVHAVTAQACFKNETKAMERYFDTREEAMQFVDKGEAENKGAWQHRLVDFQIKEVHPFDPAAFRQDLEETLKKGHPK